MTFSSLSELLMQKYPGTESGYALDCDLYGVELYDANTFFQATDCLIIFSATQISEVSVLPLSIVCLGMPDVDNYSKITTGTGNYIIIQDQCSTDALCTIMSIFGKYIKQQKLFAEINYMLLSGADISTVFCEYSRHFDCQMLAIDVSGKILTYSKPFRVDHPLWLKSVELGYLDEYLIEYILAYRSRQKLSMSTSPFVLYCDRMQLYIKVIRIISNSDILGYIFMANASGIFPYFSDKLMTILAKTLLNKLLCSRDYNSYRYSLHQNILADAIDCATEEETAQRIYAAKLKFPDNIRTVVISTSYFRGGDFLYDSLLPAVTNVLPNSAKFPKNNAIVSIIEVNEEGEIPVETIDSLHTIADGKKAIIGISNYFHNPAQISIYYKQALQTISSAKHFSQTKGVYFYSDYAFYVLLDSIYDKSLIEQSIHPLLSKLAKYDVEKNTEFYNTLRAYVKTGFSRNKTSEILFLHRNTVKYRIQQIERLYIKQRLKHRFCPLFL